MDDFAKEAAEHYKAMVEAGVERDLPAARKAGFFLTDDDAIRVVSSMAQSTGFFGFGELVQDDNGHIRYVPLSAEENQQSVQAVRDWQDGVPTKSRSKRTPKIYLDERHISTITVLSDDGDPTQ